MIHINWNPIAHLGPVPINWYGLGWAAAFLVGGWLIARWAPRHAVTRERVEGLLLWIVLGAMLGARLYYVAQHDPGAYLREPWQILAIWEGGLAFFGGLFGGILAGFLYGRRHVLPFARLADLVAPAIPVGAAIGRIPCGLAGMDYGTATSLPWGVVYTNPNAYAPVDGVARHPVQFYELAGDLAIAGVLLRLRGRMPDGALFLTYLVLFSAFRFFLFFLRGDVPAVAWGLKNGHWTAVGILIVAAVVWFVHSSRGRLRCEPASANRQRRRTVSAR